MKITEKEKEEINSIMEKSDIKNKFSFSREKRELASIIAARYLKSLLESQVSFLKCEKKKFDPIVFRTANKIIDLMPNSLLVPTPWQIGIHVSQDNDKDIINMEWFIFSGKERNSSISISIDQDSIYISYFFTERDNMTETTKKPLERVSEIYPAVLALMEKKEKDIIENI